MNGKTDLQPLLDFKSLLLISIAIGFALAGVILLILGGEDLYKLTYLVLFLSLGAFVTVFVRTVLRDNNARKLAAELAGKNIHLEQIDKMKSDFVSIASHQLRSPITAIRGSISMILEGSYGDVPPKVREVLERVEDISQAMAISVQDYLNVSRIESGKMKYTYTDADLCELVEEVVEAMRPVGQELGQRIEFVTECPAPLMLNIDVGKAKQIIQNVIDNAFKYTEGKSEVKVAIRTNTDNSRAYVDVIDQGIGIAPEDVANLFNKFERAKNASTTNSGGTGLGLYIARMMAKAMKGDITVKSDGLGKGSTFTISFSLNK